MTTVLNNFSLFQTQSPTLLSSGRIRLFSPEGDRSALATISLETTAADLAKAYDVDSIYLQIGNLHIRSLSPSARPLYILREFLSSLGHSESAIRTRGTELRFRHLIAFFLGTGEDDVVSLSRCRVDVCESRRGRCLRIQHSASVILLHFDDPEALALWSTRCRQSGQRNVCDLSDRKLTLLPESLLCSESWEVRQLNLRRNSLRVKVTLDQSPVQVGWLDDLSRLTSLTCLDLSSNRLSVFPTSIAQLPNLQKLNLSSNCIQTIPPSVRLLRRLALFDLENNWISTLPPQLVECEQLCWLNLRFNRIKQVPEEILIHLPHLGEWALAGNYIENLDVDGPVHIFKVSLLQGQLNCSKSGHTALVLKQMCGLYATILVVAI
ncbi:leucine Rich repeat-containing domain protein [Cooperia oncophora]